jgi:hypothetical protein
LDLLDHYVAFFEHTMDLAASRSLQRDRVAVFVGFRNRRNLIGEHAERAESEYPEVRIVVPDVS